MLLIATDEAGYGPKLGPLVIAGSAWQIPSPSATDQEMVRLFAPLRQRQVCEGASVVVDDSKAVYSSTSGLDALHAVVSASHHWCGYKEPELKELLPRLAAEDSAVISKTPWLAELGERPFLSRDSTAGLLSTWQETGIKLLDVRTRVITAQAFNDACERGGNKADLLSESTMGLAKELMELHSASSTIVFCDRHGGRRYYGGILQHHFSDAQLQVVSEAKLESSYRLISRDNEVEVRFTVKGDSFTPVAFSSIHAKYLRERFMESFNQYFSQYHAGELKPTAGYPVDADRFLAEVGQTLTKLKIGSRELVRSR
ncbi:MAG: hypothetical protein AB8B91_22840 [Rubripirellula sp.]